MTSIDRSSNGMWRCNDPVRFRQWLQKLPDAQITSQVDAFLAHAYKHLGVPTPAERAWERNGEVWINKTLRDALARLSEGKPWREPPLTPAGGFGPLFRRMVPENMMVSGEAGLAPAAEVLSPEIDRPVIAVITARGAPPRIQEMFARLGEELGKRSFKVVTAAAGPAEQALLKNLSAEALERARVIMGEDQKPPALAGVTPTPLQDLPLLHAEARKSLREWFPAWHGDADDQAALERDLALLISANCVIAWSDEGKEVGRLALPLLGAHQQGMAVLNLGASGVSWERVLETLTAWEDV